MEPEILKVSAKTNTKKLAKAIRAALRKHGREADLDAIGPGAVNQAIKGIIVARGLLAPEGANLKAVPSFGEAALDGRKSKIRVKVLWD